MHTYKTRIIHVCICVDIYNKNIIHIILLYYIYKTRILLLERKSDSRYWKLWIKCFLNRTLELQIWVTSLGKSSSSSWWKRAMPGKAMDGDTFCSTENSLNFSSSKFIWDQRGRDRNEKIISPCTGMEFYLKWKSLNSGGFFS